MARLFFCGLTFEVGFDIFVKRKTAKCFCSETEDYYMDIKDTKRAELSNLLKEINMSETYSEKNR